MPHATGRWGLLRLGVRALAGRLGQAQDFDALCAKEIWIETHRKRLHVAIDGEVMIMSTPLHYRVRPGALRVIVPETHESNEKEEGKRAHARPSL
jgi:diacylglycerol kinase family enzyme